jgi:hypothetical protein
VLIRRETERDADTIGAIMVAAFAQGRLPGQTRSCQLRAGNCRITI